MKKLNPKLIVGLILSVTTIYVVAMAIFAEQQTNFYWFFIALTHVMHIILCGSMLYYTTGSKHEKIRWMFYLMLVPIIGPLHWYLKYKNEINTIAERSKRKMVEKPNSLNEFNTGSH